MAGFGHILHQFFTVDHLAKGEAGLGLLLHGKLLARRTHVLIDVEQHIIGALHFVENQFAGIGGVEAVKFHGVDGVDKLGGVVLVSGQDGGVVFCQVAVDAGQLHIFGVPVVLVLLKGDDIVHFVGGHAEGAHADVGFGLGGPDALVVSNGFFHRVEGREGGQILEIGGGGSQLHSEHARFVIHGDVEV